MAQQNEKLWLGGGALGALLVAVLAWLLLIGPELSGASSLNGQADSTRSQNDLTVIKIGQLRKQNADLSQLTAQLQAAEAALPGTSGDADLTRQLHQQANQTGVLIGQLSIAKPKAVSTTGAARAGAIVSPAGQLYSMQVSMIAIGSADQVQKFLDKVQYAGPRRALVNTVALAPGAAAKTASIEDEALASITLTVFSAPQTPEAQAQLQAQLSKSGSN